MKIFKKSFWNFIINGSARSGKDTFIELFSEVLKDYKTVMINNMSTVSYIKDIAFDSFGWDGIKDEKGRQLLSDLLDADIKYQDGPFKRIISEISRFQRKNINHKIINFIHSREPDQIEKYKTYLENSHTILIRRQVNESYSNHADQNVENYNYDFIIDNNGTIEDYKKTVHSFIDSNILE